MKKVSIAIDATGGKNWIGGLYYKKNIIFSLMQNQDILEKYNIIILTNQGNDHLFAELSGKAKTILLPDLSKRMNKWFMMLTCLRYNCRYIFPYSGKKFFSYFGIKEIYWIPDFQDCHYPQFFSEEVIEQRKAISVSLVNSKESLVLSSNAAYNDLTTFFGPKKEVAVVPFVSYIEKEISEISENYEQEILNKYEIDKDKYICICNQFWQHKNHIVVLKAIKELATKYPQNDLKFVFTGELKDYRNKEYFNFLEEQLENTLVSSRCKILGFIDRKEQIVLIKNSKCLIQPSLFEGWGTVLEDAKVLDKLVILSDIPVHREQKNENCTLFDPSDPQDLMRAILEVATTNHADNISKGLEKMYVNARAYSKNFEVLLKM
jgi:glycosyltransferase involved in cell wall biosynthesis